MTDRPIGPAEDPRAHWAPPAWEEFRDARERFLARCQGGTVSRLDAAFGAPARVPEEAPLDVARPRGRGR